MKEFIVVILVIAGTFVFNILMNFLNNILKDDNEVVRMANGMDGHYKAYVECKNCGWDGDIYPWNGESVSNCNCLKCNCKSLKQSAEYVMDVCGGLVKIR